MNDEIVSNTQNEMLFVGCLFSNNDLFLEYEKTIVSKYYFIDEACKNYYDWLSVLYSNEQKFNEKNLVVYVSQDSSKLELYKKFGGWKTIQDFMDMADVLEFKSYFTTIQKFALLREMEFKGFDTSKIRNHKNFEKATTNDIYNKIRSIIDKVHTSVTSDVEVKDISSGVVEMVDSFVDRPAMGTPTFLPTYNEIFLGFQEKTMMSFGLMSNFGKTRFLAKIASYNALIQKQKTLLMLNEMSYEQLKVAVLTTVINNEEFLPLHGIKLDKKEREIKLGIYHDDDGNIIYRKKDPKTGDFIETIEEHRKNLQFKSREYRDVVLISQWLENDCFKKYLTVLNVRNDYTDSSLANHMKKNIRKGYTFVAYDNLKNETENLGNWAKLIATTTVLSETAKEEGAFCWGSIQLTDDTANFDVLDLDSNNIAASKGLKSVLDSLILGKEIEKEKYKKYRYIPTVATMGEQSKIPLMLPDSDEFRLQGHMPDKNREGNKMPILVQVDLNRNIWRELGLLIRA